MIPVAVYLEGRWILVYYLARRVVTPLSVSKAKECGAEQLAVDRCHTGIHLSCQLYIPAADYVETAARRTV